MTRVIVLAASVWLVAMTVGAAQSAQSDPATPSTTKPTAKELLRELCKAHTNEPSGLKIERLTEDDAWLVLRAACRDPKNTAVSCPAYRQTVGGVLIFHARTATWESQWEQQAWPLKFDVTGTPTLRLKPRNAKDLKIVVDGVSPLVYSAKRGTPKEEDLEVISNLKTFLSLAGSGIQSVIQTVAFASPGGPPPPPPPPPGVANPQMTEAERKAAEDRKKKLDEQCGAYIDPTQKRNGTDAPAPSPSDPQVIGPASVVGARNAKLLTLRQRLDGLAETVGRVESARHDFVKALQKIEDGTAVSSSDFKPADVTAVEAAFGTVAVAGAALRTQTRGLLTCQPMFGAYSTLLSSPSDPSVIQAFAGQVRAAQATFTVTDISQALGNEAVTMCRAAAG